MQRAPVLGVHARAACYEVRRLQRGLQTDQAEHVLVPARLAAAHIELEEAHAVEALHQRQLVGGIVPGAVVRAAQTPTAA